MRADDSGFAQRYIQVQPDIEAGRLHIYAETHIDQMPVRDTPVQVRVADGDALEGGWRNERFEGVSRAGLVLALPFDANDRRLASTGTLCLNVVLRNLHAGHPSSECTRISRNEKDPIVRRSWFFAKDDQIGLTGAGTRTQLAVCGRAHMEVQILEQGTSGSRALAKARFFLEPVGRPERSESGPSVHHVAEIPDDRKHEFRPSGRPEPPAVIRDAPATLDGSAGRSSTLDWRSAERRARSAEPAGPASNPKAEDTGHRVRPDHIANENDALRKRLRAVENELALVKSDLRRLKHEVNTREAARRTAPNLDSESIREVVIAQNRRSGLTQEFVHSVADLRTEVRQSGSQVQESIQAALARLNRLGTRADELGTRADELERRLAGLHVSPRRVEMMAQSVLVAEVRSALGAFESGASARDPMLRKRALLATLADELRSTGAHEGLVTDLGALVGAETVELAAPEMVAATGNSIAQLLILLIKNVQSASQTTQAPLDDGACVAALHKVGGVCTEQQSVGINGAVRDAWIRALAGWGLRPEEPAIGRQLQRDRALNKGRDPASPHRRNEVAQVLRPALIRDSDGEVREPAWVLLGAST